MGVLSVFANHWAVEVSNQEFVQMKRTCRAVANICRSVEEYRNWVHLDRYMSNCGASWPWTRDRVEIKNNFSKYIIEYNEIPFFNVWIYGPKQGSGSSWKAIGYVKRWTDERPLYQYRGNKTPYAIRYGKLVFQPNYRRNNTLHMNLSDVDHVDDALNQLIDILKEHGSEISDIDTSYSKIKLSKIKQPHLAFKSVLHMKLKNNEKIVVNEVIDYLRFE